MTNNTVTIIFHVVCLLATLATTVYCIYKYLLNEDASNITYQKFGVRPEDKYPTLSFCFYGDTIFNGNKLKELVNEDTNDNAIILYKQYLNGAQSRDNVSSIAYDTVTIDIGDHLTEVSILSTDAETIYEWKNSTYNWH